MKRGMTIMELLISMAVLSILITSTTVILTTTLRGAARAQVNAKIKSTGGYIMDALAANTRFATDVTCPASPTQTVVVTQRSINNKITYSCRGSSTTTLADDDIASDSARLNSDDTYVSNCQISCVNNNTQVNISFALGDLAGATTPINFVSKIVLRNR